MSGAREGWKPLDYGRAACDTMMRKFEADELPPKGHFHYHQGVFLSGMYQIYELGRRREPGRRRNIFAI